ncbi:hypothetical protein POX_b02330 [Penicillium oxalicum]|uniref:hypothetical protein n=1 Tax=Penicillium oxalicum TaxID=69781 RepID=UPI0020B6DA11|nr:hypothetical protein POX_b02330 [Penicillium oxalicum]KAI2792293.1 hypothetical protein POX_b02330 [Penicillium oxalicum]
MAEKRKLRAGREPAAKRRVSEAVTPSQKKKASTPRVPSPPPPPPPPPEPVEPLPISIKDGEPVPVLRERQPSDLSDKEYQSYAESAVLLTALERSKKKWLSDGILVRYYTKPKKTKREQIEKNNPPKDSMTRVGPCDVTVGPHLFDAMIYTVKDPNAPPAIQYAPPPKQMAHYGHAPNFQQYQPYPGNQKRPPYPPAPAARPSHGYPGTHPTPPQQRGPSHTQPQSTQRPPQNTQPGQPAKPSPDPVIQMLATRAAADPELKALMRVVASSQASQEQLRAFQAHIDELNAIIKAREQQAQRNAAAAAAAHRPPAIQQPAASAHFSRPASPQVVITQRPASLPATHLQRPGVPNQQTSLHSTTADGARTQPTPLSNGASPATLQRTPATSSPVPMSTATPTPIPAQSSATVAAPGSTAASATTPVPTGAPVTPTPAPPFVSIPTATPTPNIGQNPGPLTSTPSEESQKESSTPGQNQPSTPAQTAPTQAANSSSLPASTASVTVETRPVVKQEPVTTNVATAQTATPASVKPPLPAPPATVSSSAGMLTPTPTPQMQAPPAVQIPPSSTVTQQVPRPTPPQPGHQQQPPYGPNAPVQSRPPAYGSPSPYYRPQAPPPRPVPAPINYKSVVFEFTSPLTPYGSSTSGHAGSGDRYLFPEHSILEWLPNENTILASFLIVKKVDPNTPFPIDTAPDGGTGRKSKGASKSKKATKADKAIATPTPADTPQKQEPSDEKIDVKPSETETPAPANDKSGSESNLKEYWQPVTFRIHAANPRILEPLTRVVKPADEVRKYMNEIMDRAERAPDGFPAFRLPYEDAREAFEAESTPVSTPVAVPSSRSRPPKASIKKIEEEPDVENHQEEEEEEEELMDFYGAPTGLPPLRV